MSTTTTTTNTNTTNTNEVSLKETLVNTVNNSLDAINTAMVTVNDVMQTIELTAKITKNQLAVMYIEGNKELFNSLTDDEKSKYNKFLN